MKDHRTTVPHNKKDSLEGYIMHRFDPIEPLIHIMDETKPELSFFPQEDYETWKTKAYNKLIELTGYDKFSKANPEVKIEYVHEYEGHKEIRFTMKTEEHCEMPCHLLVPKDIVKPPLMVCLQGHSTGMHISMGKVKYENDKKSIDGGRDFAIQAVNHGMAALCVEQRGFGERKEHPESGNYECYVPTMTEILNGRTTVGARVWDVARALDVIEDEFPEVDMERVFIIGTSGGGTSAYYTACIEERIKALIPSCSLSSYRYSIGIMKHCVCNHIPHIRQYFEMGRFGGAYSAKANGCNCRQK